MTTDDPHRKPTVQIPTTSNVVLAAEKVEAFTVALDRNTRTVEQVGRRLEALGDIVEHQAKLRESGDEKLGRSLDRLADRIHQSELAHDATVRLLSETRALAAAAVDISQSVAETLQKLLERGGDQVAQHSKPAE